MDVDLINPDEPPSVFMDLDTGAYPVFDQNIRDLYPDVDLPVPLTAESVASLGFVPVLRTVRGVDCCSFVWRRLEPAFDESLGYYETWTYEPAEGSIHEETKPSPDAEWNTVSNSWVSK